MEIIHRFRIRCTAYNMRHCSWRCAWLLHSTHRYTCGRAVLEVSAVAAHASVALASTLRFAPRMLLVNPMKAAEMHV